MDAKAAKLVLVDSSERKVSPTFSFETKKSTYKK